LNSSLSKLKSLKLSLDPPTTDLAFNRCYGSA
jgi:hypothetical protein